MASTVLETLSATLNVPRAFGVTVNMPGFWAMLLGGTTDDTVLINVLGLIFIKGILMSKVWSILS